MLRVSVQGLVSTESAPGWRRCFIPDPSKAFWAWMELALLLAAVFQGALVGILHTEPGGLVSEAGVEALHVS